MQYVIDNNICIDTTTNKVLRNGKRVKLTRLGYALMRYMMLHPDRLCLRDQIGEYVWQGKKHYEIRNLYTHLYNLRNRLGLQKKQPFETVHGIGLIFHSGAYGNRLPQDLWWVNNFPIEECGELEVCDLEDLVIEAVLSCGKEIVAAQIKVNIKLSPPNAGIIMLRQRFADMFRHLLLAIMPVIHTKTLDISSSLQKTGFVLSVAADGWHDNGSNPDWQTANAIASMLGITLQTHDSKGHVSIELHIQPEQENS